MVALSLIAVFAPIMVLIFAVLMLSGGSPVFAHTRVGRNGRKFLCYKFRTMRPESSRVLRLMLRTVPPAADEWHAKQKLTHDPRITWLGRFLRKTSLDELPQLFNVLRGDMSMVGPRPVTRKELLRYGLAIPLYLSVRPGLTGPWQVHGRGVTTFDERVRMDGDYVRSVNFATDLKLCFLTAGIVLRRTGT